MVLIIQITGVARNIFFFVTSLTHSLTIRHDKILNTTDIKINRYRYFFAHFYQKTRIISIDEL